jgi:hypothetical protein
MYRTSAVPEYAEEYVIVVVIDDVEHVLLSVNDHVVHRQLICVVSAEVVATYAHRGRRNATIKLLAPLIFTTTWASVSKQAVV